MTLAEAYLARAADEADTPVRVPFVRLAACLLLTLAAAPLTLYTAWTEWQFQSAVAELVFVPVVAAAVGVAVAVRYPFVATSRLGRPDWWVALGALAVLAMVQLWSLILPGSYAWVLRPDAFSLPAVTLAALSLLFGVRALVVFYPVVGLMLLAWPLPASGMLELVSDPVTRLTGLLVRAGTWVLPVASDVSSAGSDVTLTVPHGAGEFLVQVSSACAGIGGMLGIAVVCAGLLYFFDGRWRDKLRWLGAAVLLAYAANVLRIMLLLVVGRVFGEEAAVGTLHTYAGLVILNLVLLASLTAAGRFGLTRRPLRPVASDNPLHAVTPVGVGHARAVRRRGAVLLALCAGLGMLNLQFASAAPAYHNSGLEAVRPLGRLLPVADLDREVRALGEERWARKYFGSDSRWTRYELVSRDMAVPTTWIDVIDTGSVGALRTHSVLRCYDLHEHEVLARKRVTLGSGVNVDVFVVQMDRGVWHAVSWERPITRAGKVAHERVTLMASSLRKPIPGGFEGSETSEGLRGRLLAGLNTILPDEDPNPEVSASLLALADDIENEQLHAAAASGRG